MIRKLTAIGWEQGKLSQSGNKLYAGTSKTEIRSISYIKTSNVSFAISALTSIFKKLQFQIWYFDEDKKYIVNSYSGWQNSYTYLPKTNYPYMQITLRYSNSATIEVSQILNVYLFEQSNTEIQLPLYMETNILGGSRINESQNAYKKIYQYQYVSLQEISIDYNYSINKKLEGQIPFLNNFEIDITWYYDFKIEMEQYGYSINNPLWGLLNPFLTNCFEYTSSEGDYKNIHIGYHIGHIESLDVDICEVELYDQDNHFLKTCTSFNVKDNEPDNVKFVPVATNINYNVTSGSYDISFNCLSYVYTPTNQEWKSNGEGDYTGIARNNNFSLKDYYSYEILQG